MAFKCILTNKMTELLMFEVRCKKYDGGKESRLPRFSASVIDL